VSLQVSGLEPDTDWQNALKGVDVVIHSAARVHVMEDKASDPLAAFRKVNVEGTLNLARQAAELGVRRFISISSIKVNGEGTSLGMPYLADAQPAPADPYGISKMEAEQGLRELAAESGMEVVIIRPPLVYGPGVKANFLNMMRWLHKGVPLPFGAIHNRRSLVALDNLVDLIVTCIGHPAAANQTFLVSDGEDLSTTELLRGMGTALGKPARLLPVPSWLLETGAAMLGKQALSQRLCGSLQVDISKTRELLNWTPPVSVDEALRKTAKHFLEQQAK
jgi:nucleoside-diphosphate-sugar epimerase